MKRLLAFVLVASSLNSFSQTHSLVKKWESDSVFKVPESVLYDADHGLLYVSNIDGKDPWGKDGIGSIGKMDLNGNVISAQWIMGFNAPKGMGLYAHTLYVADLTRVVVVDLHQEKIVNVIDVPGAEGLNDISIDPNGVIYVTDSKVKKLFRVQNGVASVYVDKLKAPNGVLAKGTALYLLDNGGAYKVNADKSLKLIADGMDPGTDGIEEVKPNEFLVSNWSGVLWYVNANGSKEKLLDTREQKINSADIGYDPATKTVFVPTFWKNSVGAYEVK